MRLAILDVVADPVLSLNAASAGGEPLWAQVFTGACRLGKPPREKGATRLTGSLGPFNLGFYVPSAGPFRPSHQLQAWADMSLATLQTSARQSARGPYGVDPVTVQLVDDQRGSGSMWPYLSFTAHGAEPMVLRYRVTVTLPKNL